MSDLRPCPFNQDHEVAKEYREKLNGYFGGCIDCGIGMPIEKWNARPQLDEAVEALEKIANYGVNYTKLTQEEIAQEALSEIAGDCDDSSE